MLSFMSCLNVVLSRTGGRGRSVRVCVCGGGFVTFGGWSFIGTVGKRLQTHTARLEGDCRSSAGSLRAERRYGWVARLVKGGGHCRYSVSE